MVAERLSTGAARGEPQQQLQLPQRLPIFGLTERLDAIQAFSEGKGWSSSDVMMALSNGTCKIWVRRLVGPAGFL
jgi:hypothetical protein